MAVRFQLAVDGAEMLGRIACSGVDEVREDASSLEVREELVAEADPLGCTLDQPGNVRDDELAAVGRVDRAQHGRERGERILGDLRLCVRDQPQERRLAGIRLPDQRRVREQLEVQLEIRLVPGHPYLRETRRLVGWGGEAPIAAAARAAPGDGDAPARARQIGDQPPLLVQHLRPRRDAQLDVGSCGAMAPRSPARAALAGADPSPRPESGQVTQLGVGDEHDRAARAAVAAVRAALRHVLLAPEAERAVAAPAGGDVDAGTVAEHRSQCGSDAAAHGRSDRVAPPPAVPIHARPRLPRLRHVRTTAGEPRAGGDESARTQRRRGIVRPERHRTARCGPDGGGDAAALRGTSAC